MLGTKAGYRRACGSTSSSICGRARAGGSCRAADRLARRGVAVAQFETADGHEALTRALHATIKAGAKAVVVGGGDGTMMVAANELTFVPASFVDEGT